MTTATVTSKGQITIPANVREALKVEAGDRVEFVEVEPGRFEVVAATRSVTELKGMFGKPAKSVSIDEMNQAIAAIPHQPARPEPVEGPFIAHQGLPSTSSGRSEIQAQPERDGVTQQRCSMHRMWSQNP